jgi:hypothetical protein
MINALAYWENSQVTKKMKWCEYGPCIRLSWSWQIIPRIKRRHDIWHNNTQHNDIQYNNKLNATLSVTTLSLTLPLC